MAIGSKFLSIVPPNSGDQTLSTSPHAVITFIRFANRSPVKLKNNPAKATETIQPFTVTSDVVALSIREQKEGYSSSMSASLKGGDVNYLTAIAPGDYAIVNIVDGPDQANEIRARAENGQPINRYEQSNSPNGNAYINDGFKGIFKLQSVRRTVNQQPNGPETVTYSIVAYSHYFLTNKVYFIPQLVNVGETINRYLFFESISKKIQGYFAAKAATNVQSVIEILLDAFLGTDFNGNKNEFRSPTQTYFVPESMAGLLGVKGKRAIDMTNVILGAQTYQQTGLSNATPANIRANPTLSKKQNTRVWKSPNGRELFGEDYSTPQQFNMMAVGDILKNYLNDIVNEMYVCHRLDPQEGLVLPTMVFREKPFTSIGGPGRTKFFDLPRWYIDPLMLSNVDLGRDEAARINFVQVYGRTLAPNMAGNFAEQVALKNFQFDLEDIKVSGLRPYVTTSNMDFPKLEGKGPKSISQSATWARMVADWLFGGHLKLNGTVTTKGIYAPITPGDNAQLEGTTLHIESVSHQFTMNGDNRSFNTQLTLSHGMEYDDTKVEANSFPEMLHQDASERAGQFDPPERILPSVNVDEYQPGRFAKGQMVKSGPIPARNFSGKGQPKK